MIKNSFVWKLAELQLQYSYTDTQMAKLIGCSRQWYNATKNNKAKLNFGVLRGACKAFPELEPYATKYLMGATGDETL